MKTAKQLTLRIRQLGLARGFNANRHNAFDSARLRAPASACLPGARGSEHKGRRRSLSRPFYNGGGCSESKSEKKKKTQWRRRGELAHGEVRPGGARSFGTGPHSQPPVPQAATGNWNLNGKTEAERGDQLNESSGGSRVRARGLTVKRWADRTKNAGEVHSDEKAQGLINRLKEWTSGVSKLPKMTTEDGELKTGKEYAWSVSRPAAAVDAGAASLSPPVVQAVAVVTREEND